MAESLLPTPLGYAAIESLLPHAAPMVFLDAVESWDLHRIRCSAQSHLALDNPLRQGGILSVYAGVEYAAQAQILHAHLSVQADVSTVSRKGFVAVASRLEAQVRDLDEIAAPLQIELTQLAVTDQSSLYQFALSAAGTLLLQGELLAVLAPTEESVR